MTIFWFSRNFRFVSESAIFISWSFLLGDYSLFKDTLTGLRTISDEWRQHSSSRTTRNCNPHYSLNSCMTNVTTPGVSTTSVDLVSLRFTLAHATCIKPASAFKRNGSLLAEWSTIPNVTRTPNPRAEALSSDLSNLSWAAQMGYPEMVVGPVLYFSALDG